LSTDEIVIAPNEPVKVESVSIIQQAVNILQDFEVTLKRICEQGDSTPIENILQLFPDVDQA
ncbi:unnamed protein product, partial [Rotaria magnacalcarata]